MALALSVSCGAPTVRADIEAFANLAVPLENLGAFTYQASQDETHALRNQVLYQQVRHLLERQGLAETSHGDFFVTLQTRTEKTTIEYPGHYEMGPRMQSGFYGTTYVRGADGKVHPTLGYSPRVYHSSPYRVPGRSVPAFEHHLALDFRDANGELLWQGTIDMVHRSRDLSSLMKMFLPDLLSEFPAPSGKSMERRVQVED